MKLEVGGELNSFLEYVKSDNELRIEVRTKGKLIVYYKKCKALELSATSATVDNKYFIKSQPLSNDSIGRLICSNPKAYFDEIKNAINIWQVYKNRTKAEFESQQRIATVNDWTKRFFIIDMEYSFSLDFIKYERPKRVSFDLLGIDLHTGRLVFFELKKGMGATAGKSGIQDHIQDFETYFGGDLRNDFMNQLIVDVQNIIGDKMALGIIDYFNIEILNLKQMPEYIFIFHPDNDEQIINIRNEVGAYKLLIISDNNYVLNENSNT